MQEQLQADHATVTPMSLPERLLGVVVRPEAVFAHVRDTGPTRSNWIAPLLLFAAATAALTAVLLSDASLTAQVSAAMSALVDEFVQQGLAPEEQVAAQFSLMRPGTPVFAVMAVLGPTLWALATTFALAYLFRLIGRSAMNADAPYMKIVEVTGLTFVIAAIDVAATAALMLATQRADASPTLAFALDATDHTSSTTLLLSRLNPFTLWMIAAISVGLSRLFRRDFPKVLVLLASLWLLWTLVLAFS